MYVCICHGQVNFKMLNNDNKIINVNVNWKVPESILTLAYASISISKHYLLKTLYFILIPKNDQKQNYTIIHCSFISALSHSPASAWSNRETDEFSN